MKIYSKKDKLEYEFLPDALEVIETPPSKFGRSIIWIIFLLLVTIVVWSSIGEVDEVAVARGKFISDGRVKVVQSYIDGVITDIYITSGQFVKEGEILFKLDSDLKSADIDALKKEQESFMDTLEVYSSLTKGKSIEKGNSSIYKAAIAKDNLYIAQKNSLAIEVEKSEILLKIENDKMKQLSDETSTLQEELDELIELSKTDGLEYLNLLNYQIQLDELQKDEVILKILYDEGVVSKLEWEKLINNIDLLKSQIKVQERKVEIEKLETKNLIDKSKNALKQNLDNIEIQTSVIEQVKVSIDSIKNKIVEIEANKAGYYSETIVNTEMNLDKIKSQIDKINMGIEFSNIHSPVDGTISSISQNTIGGIVTPAQVLTTIIPADTPLIVEAYLPNKDRGFIKVGQDVAIKLDTFSFQKYGLIKGKVDKISPDAFEIENVGTMYIINVTLDKQSIMIEENEIPFSPGMTLSAEIKTGKKKIIAFFLEPLIKYAHESLSVR